MDVPNRTVFENNVPLDELGYKSTRINWSKSQYETNYNDAVYNSENSKPGYALYRENTRDVKKTDKKYMNNPKLQINQSWFPQS